MKPAEKRPAVFDSDIFPIRITIQKDRPTLVSMHWHDELELIRVLKGPVLIQLDEQEFTAETGDVVFIEANCSHFVKCIGMSNKAIEGIVFSKQLFEENVVDFSAFASGFIMLDTKFFYLDIKHPLNTVVLQCMENMYTEYTTRPVLYQMSIKGTLYQMMSQLLRYYFTTISNSTLLQKKVADLNRLQPVFTYIKNHYTNTITLSALSQEVNMSPYYFSRFFKEAIGYAPIDYVIKYRIRMSIRLLVNSDNSIAQIAEQVGFSTINYFDKAFKSIYHMSPSDYKKLLL